MNEVQKKIEIAGYYSICLGDLDLGVSIEDMNKTLLYFEELENYLACEGIKKAIEDYKLIQSNNETV